MSVEFLTNYRDPEFWVLVGLILFFALLIYFKVPGAAMGAIDGRRKAIQNELDEARRIREEAQTLLNSLKLKRLETERQAKEMLAAAEAEAKLYEAEAKAKLEESLVRRQALAERRIALAESQAAQDVKAAAADLATEIAGVVLESRLKGKRSDPLVDGAISQLASRLS